MFLFCISHEDGSVSGWAVNDGALAFTVQGHESTINSLAVSRPYFLLVHFEVQKIFRFEKMTCCRVNRSREMVAGLCQEETMPLPR